MKTEVVENFPEYMVYYAVYGEPGYDVTDEDIQLFEEWRERNGYGWCYGLDSDENEYVEKSFDSHPAFGLPCDTVPVVFEKIQSSRRHIKSSKTVTYDVSVRPWGGMTVERLKDLGFKDANSNSYDNVAFTYTTNEPSTVAYKKLRKIIEDDNELGSIVMFEKQIIKSALGSDTVNIAERIIDNIGNYISPRYLTHGDVEGYYDNEISPGDASDILGELNWKLIHIRDILEKAIDDDDITDTDELDGLRGAINEADSFAKDVLTREAYNSLAMDIFHPIIRNFNVIRSSRRPIKSSTTNEEFQNDYEYFTEDEATGIKVFLWGKSFEQMKRFFEKWNTKLTISDIIEKAIKYNPKNERMANLYISSISFSFTVDIICTDNDNNIIDEMTVGLGKVKPLDSSRKPIESSQKGYENVVEGTPYDDYHIDTTGMGILDVEHIINEIEGRGNQAVLTVKTSDGATQHTQFNAKDWKAYKDAVNGVDEFSRNSRTKGAAITDVWVTEVKGGSYVRNSRRPVKSGVPFKNRGFNLTGHEIQDMEWRIDSGETVDYNGWTFMKDDNFDTIVAISPEGKTYDGFKSLSGFLDLYEYGSIESSRRPIKSGSYGAITYPYPKHNEFSDLRDKARLGRTGLYNVGYLVKKMISVCDDSKTIGKLEEFATNHKNDGYRTSDIWLDLMSEEIQSSIVRSARYIATDPETGEVLGSADTYEEAVNEWGEDVTITDSEAAEGEENMELFQSRKSIKSDLNVSDEAAYWDGMEDGINGLNPADEDDPDYMKGWRNGRKRLEGHNYKNRILDDTLASSKKSETTKQTITRLLSSVISGEMTEDEAAEEIAQANDVNIGYARNIFSEYMNDKERYLTSGMLELGEALNVDFDPDGDIDTWFVDFAGDEDKPAPTLGGELVKAARYIIRAFRENGEKIGWGYARETLNPAARFIIDNTDFGGNDELKSMIEGDVPDDNGYEKWINSFEEDFADYLRDHSELFEKLNNTDFMDSANESDEYNTVDEFFVEDDEGNQYWFQNVSDGWTCVDISYDITPDYDEGDIITAEDYMFDNIDFNEEFGEFMEAPFEYSWEDGDGESVRISNVRLMNGLYEIDDYISNNELMEIINDGTLVYDKDGNELKAKDIF